MLLIHLLAQGFHLPSAMARLHRTAGEKVPQQGSTYATLPASTVAARCNLAAISSCSVSGLIMTADSLLTHC